MCDTVLLFTASALFVFVLFITLIPRGMDFGCELSDQCYIIEGDSIQDFRTVCILKNSKENKN